MPTTQGDFGVAGHQRHLRDDHGSQAHDEAHRQIDAAGDDDEGLAGGEQQRRTRRQQNGLGVIGVEQKGPPHLDLRPDLEEDEQGEEKQPWPQPGQQGDAPQLIVDRDIGHGQRSLMQEMRAPRPACGIGGERRER